MSRIEKALEKAIKQKTSEQEDRDSRLTPSSAPTPSVLARKVAKLTWDSPLLVKKAPSTSIAEQYRKLMSMIFNLDNGSPSLRTMMVTSSLAGEGKSITALNLAVTLARDYDQSVILVDADLRDPSISRQLGIIADKGLSDCLKDGVSIDEVLVKTDVDKCTIIPSGTLNSNPARLISSPRMKELLSEISQNYADNYLIIDTPPLLPFAEVPYLSHLVNGILLVVREGHATTQVLNESLALLKDGNLLGVVYNDATLDWPNLASGYYPSGNSPRPRTGP